MSSARVRRQNHSCEQCRRSRKACDGYSLNCHQSCTPVPDHHLLPCSYCTKTSKCCSLNVYWGEVLPTPRTLSASSTKSRNEELQSVRRIKRQRTSLATGTDSGSLLGFAAHESGASAPTNSTGVEDSLHDVLNLFSTPSTSDPSLWSDPTLGWNDQFTLSPSCPSSAEAVDFPLDSSYGNDVLPQIMLPTQQTSYRSMPLVDDFSIFPVGSNPYTSSLDADDSTWLDPDVTSILHSSRAKVAQLASPCHDIDYLRSSKKHALAACPRTDSISSFNANYGMMTSMNNSLITESLLGIYHDVLENNLACWLSEDTCPYKMRSRRTSELNRLKLVPPGNNMRQAADSTWSNRMYGRVVQLDRAAQKAGQLRLTRSENSAASKALSLAVLAFATQWSQGMQNTKTQQPLYSDAFRFDYTPHDENYDFEQNVKQSTWDQARRALEDCSHLESYRVVYAELVFGLVTSPSERPGEVKSNSREQADVLARGKREVTKMLAAQSQPVFIERATRKIHAMKFRLDAAETGFGVSAADSEPPAELSPEDRSTIGLVYWFAVMLDTVSSSISEKPVALTDEDCQHEDLSETTDRSNQLVHQRWEARLFVQDDLEVPSATLSWPCSYHEAAEAVVRSAPVKVLLFRYVSYLQNTLRKRQFGRPTEDVISGALLLYKYWGMTYGSFFRSLIRDYNNVPARIKSWFVCIVVPWHLGSLMLADLIEFVDTNSMGSEQASRARIAEGLTSNIRQASAIELADIAVATTPTEHDTGNRNLPDLHFAVNQGSLLTEPWTMLLVNAFAKAALYHLNVLDRLEKSRTSTLVSIDKNVQGAVKRINACAQCLLFLGRKTAIASDIAIVLLKAIGHYQWSR